MLAQPKLLSWPSAKTRILNQLHHTSTIHDPSSQRRRRSSSITSKIPSYPLFSSRSLTKFQFNARLQAFAYYQAIVEDENSTRTEDILITSLFYDDPKDPRSALCVYFTSLNTGIIRKCLKYDFQFPSFQLLKHIPKLKLIVGYSNNRLSLLSNQNGRLKYLTSVSCPGTPRRIIHDKTSQDIIYVGGENGLFVRWYLVRENNGYELRLGDRLKSVFTNRQNSIIDMKLDPVTHKLFLVGPKGCLIFNTLLNRESVSVLSAHGAPVTCANIYGFSIIMGFSDGVMKIFEMGGESVPVRYQLKVHTTAMINLLITTDGIVITAADDGTICFYSLESLIKLGEHRFTERIERIMFVRGEDLLVKFANDLQLLTYTLPIRSFSAAVQSIEQLRVTFPVGSIPARVVVRSTQNLFTIYNPRSTQIINNIPLSPDRMTVNDFVYDSAGEILYVLTNKTVCSYHCATHPSYLINLFEVNDECLFTKLCCIMWFSLLPEHTRKRRAFGIVFVGTTNGKLYLVPGEHGLKYALLNDTPEALYSYFQILNHSTSVGCLEIFQSYETYTTRRGERYLLAIGNDFIGKFYRISISGHEIFLRELGVPIHLDAPCIAAAMAEQRIAIACALRGYIRMYAITSFGLDEIVPQDIFHEHPPIKSLTACDTLGLFSTLNTHNEIMLWTRNNQVIRKLRCDVPLISIVNLNDRGDILLISNRRLLFLMISDFAPEEILFDLSKKTMKDDPIEQPVQVNKNFDHMIHPKTSSTPPSRQRKNRAITSAKNSHGPTRTIRLDERATPQVASDVHESDVLGFFEALEQEQAQAEMAKMLARQRNPPIAPDASIPNSILRSMFKMQEIEPVEVKMFRLRLIPLSSSTRTPQMDFDERLKRYSVLTNVDGIQSTIFQSLNQIDILENLQSKTKKNHNWQNDDDEWVELGDPEATGPEQTSKPSSAKTKSKKSTKATGTTASGQKFADDFSRMDIDYDILYDEDSLPEVFKRMKKEPWWQFMDEDGMNNLRSMLMYLVDVLRDKDPHSYESACNYVVEVFRTYGIEPTLVEQIIGILTDHLALSENDPLDVHTVRTIAQFMMERKNIIIALLTFASKYQPNDILRHETISAVKFITDVNSSDDIDLVLNHMPVVRDAVEDSFSLKTIIDRIKSKQKQAPANEAEETADEIDVLHPLLKKISEERWFPRDNESITLDSVLNAILAKLPNASKSMLKTLTTHLVQLHRTFGYSNEQYDRVSSGLLTLLSHNDADYRLISATILADLGKETKAVDLALLNSFITDPRILVRTECCDSLKRITGVMSDTVLKDCADDIPYLQTLPEEDFSLQNYWNEKNRVPTPPPTTADKQPSVPVEEAEETKAIVVDEEEKQVENVIPTTRPDEYDESGIILDDSTAPLPSAHLEDIPSIIRSRTPSAHFEEPSEFQKGDNIVQPISSQFSITVSANSSTTLLTPVEPPIRVEISEKTKPFIVLTQHLKQTRKEVPPPPAPPSSSSRPSRARRQATEPINRTSIQITLSDQSTGRRHLLLPNNSDMWDSYAKQTEVTEEDEFQIIPSSEINQATIGDPIQTILDDHKHHVGYFRMNPNRRVLVPHKINFDDIFGDSPHKSVDQSHMTVDRKIPVRSLSRPTSTMHLSDLNRNKRHLQEVEFVQLLSSLVIRAIQVHKKHERFIPGPFSAISDSYSSFTDALTISQMQLHAPLNLEQANLFVPTILPPLVKKRPSSAQIARIKSDVHLRAKRTGVNLRKAKDMEDALSQLLKSDRIQSRSTLVPANTPHPSSILSTIDPNEVTHAWLLEQLLRSQGAPNSQNYIHQIIRAYPKFTPLLHSRIPPDLIPIIWNDPVLKQLASIITNKPDESPVEESPTKRIHMKPSIPTIDDDHSSNLFDYAASNHLVSMQQQRDEQKRRRLPAIRGAKMRLPRHVLKFGFRELETDAPETSLDSLRDESITKSRRRRIYMHLMMSVNDNLLVRHELVKSQYRQMLKTDYPSSPYLPIIAKPPVFE